MKAVSLTRQALITVFLAELFCAVALSGAAILHERHIRFRAFDVMLQGRSDSLLGAVQDAEDPEDNITIDRTELNLPPADVFAVYNRGGRLLGASPDVPAPLIRRSRESFTDREFEGHRYRVLQRDALRIIDREETNGVGLRRPVTILYGARTDHLWHEILEAAAYSAIVSLVLLCATTTLLLLTLRRILRPLDALAIAAGRISTTSLGFEPPAEALRLRELQPLATALTATMTRLRGAFETQHRFVGDATHELKTAVAVVRSTVELLMLRQRTSEEYHAGLLRTLEDNRRVEDLVSRMLLLARVEEHAPDAVAPVNFDESIKAVLKNLESLSEKHSVVLKSDLQSRVQVRLAPDRAAVLVSNLVVNALQHSGPGTTVRIGLHREPTSCGRAAFTVLDNGSGISSDALPHIFERFYREDSSRSRQTGGAGLGLAICQAIVEAAGGSIEVESTPGKGTKVTVLFSINSSWRA